MKALRRDYNRIFCMIMLHGLFNWGHHTCGSLIEGGKSISDCLESAAKVSALRQAMIDMDIIMKHRW